ncbi:hypothetical protein D3C80_1102280 [compost metagenome]
MKSLGHGGIRRGFERCVVCSGLIAGKTGSHKVCGMLYLWEPGAISYPSPHNPGACHYPE